MGRRSESLPIFTAAFHRPAARPYYWRNSRSSQGMPEEAAFIDKMMARHSPAPCRDVDAATMIERVYRSRRIRF